jgi:hypothetical protein
MAKGPIEFINDLTVNKVRWEEQSSADQKAYVPFMMNRWISMSQDWVEIVAETQRYTAVIPPRINYLFYHDIMPKAKLWIKYAKSKGEIAKELTDLIEFVSTHLSVSKHEAEEYIDIMMKTGKSDELAKWIEQFGFNKKEISKFKIQ